MSKFFKALEKVDQENEARERGPADVAAGIALAPAAEVETAPEPVRPTPRVAPRPQRRVAGRAGREADRRGRAPPGGAGDD